jgi:hypothetical protein
VIAAELERTANMYDGLDPADDASAANSLAGYLSIQHVRHAEQGCPLPSLTPEIARADDAAKAAYQAGLLEISTTVVGAGAVGSFYGAMLARAGHAVTLIGRAPHVQAIRAERGLQLHMNGQTHAVPLAASTELDAVRDADLVLFCVKSTDTDAVARQIAPLLKPDALVLSLQNGVDNAETLARHLTGQRVVPVAVYVATAMPGPGEVQHHGRGDLVIGPIDAAAAADTALAVAAAGGGGSVRQRRRCRCASRPT